MVEFCKRARFVLIAVFTGAALRARGRAGGFGVNFPVAVDMTERIDGLRLAFAANRAFAGLLATGRAGRLCRRFPRAERVLQQFQRPCFARAAVFAFPCFRAFDGAGRHGGDFPFLIDMVEHIDAFGLDVAAIRTHAGAGAFFCTSRLCVGRPIAVGVRQFGNAPFFRHAAANGTRLLFFARRRTGRLADAYPLFRGRVRQRFNGACISVTAAVAGSYFFAC